MHILGIAFVGQQAGIDCANTNQHQDLPEPVYLCGFRYCLMIGIVQVSPAGS